MRNHRLINEDPPAAEEVLTQIRSYSMNICKQMKNKLLYLEKTHFCIRTDKGSAKNDQVYIDCSTAIYEYLKLHLIEILTNKFNCEENTSKRRIVTDDNFDIKSEVECQFSVKFSHNDINHKVHITFYYTKCSIWIQGSPTKINNTTIAQFFCHKLC